MDFESLQKKRKKVIFELKEAQRFSGSILNQTTNDNSNENMITAEDSRTKFQSMIKGSWDIDIGKRPVIVIDNGSYECRAGWSNDLSDKPFLNFKNQISKPKTQISKEIDAMHLIGEEFSLFDASKLQKKTMFDREVVTNSNLLEHLFDYCFSHLGINEQIQNPILLTEAMSNPNQSRIQTNELMFECYGAPAVSYAVDTLCGYFNSSEMGSSLRDGLIINSGSSATHIIPILNGTQLISHSKRIPIGGTQHFDLL